MNVDNFAAVWVLFLAVVLFFMGVRMGRLRDDIKRMEAELYGEPKPPRHRFEAAWRFLLWLLWGG